MKLIFGVLIAINFDHSFVLAHPGHSTPVAGFSKVIRNESARRITQLPANALSVPGAFVSLKDSEVQIRQVDDSLVVIELSHLTAADQEWVRQRMERIRETNFDAGSLFPGKFPDQRSGDTDSYLNQTTRIANRMPQLLALLERKKYVMDENRIPEIARTFASFVKAQSIKTRWDDRFFYVESRGIPDHRMMVGITAWQQQVPIPQAYSGENAWQIPLRPVPARNPQSTKGKFLRGAIAIAANGVPIFNPLNNRGEDANLFGELDEFGGHCGRADDYHYHLAPVHLQKLVGPGLPIAYALDGYPIYGYEEADGSKVRGLDPFNGHEDKQGNYHYHASKTYPYLNGGFHGEVTQRGDQVDPQPRAEPLRPDLRPLRDARITDFVETKPGSFLLTYDVKGKKGTVSYTLSQSGGVSFAFVDTIGNKTTETYRPKQRGPGPSIDGPGKKRRPPPPPR